MFEVISLIESDVAFNISMIIHICNSMCKRLVNYKIIAYNFFRKILLLLTLIHLSWFLESEEHLR